MIDMCAVGARCRSVGTDDVRSGAVRRRSAGKTRVLLTSRIQTLTAAELSVVAVRTCPLIWFFISEIALITTKTVGHSTAIIMYSQNGKL